MINPTRIDLKKIHIHKLYCQLYSSHTKDKKVD
jgi:hypothetical protein